MPVTTSVNLATVSSSLAASDHQPATNALNNTLPTEQLSASIVIVGAGMAGSRLAIQLATTFKDMGLQDDAPEIVLISKEPQVGYNRIMLSPVLAGEKSFKDTYVYSKKDYQALGITVIAGVSVEKIDTDSKTLTLDNSHCIHYNKLVLATGSTARVIPFDGHQAPQVHVFRDVADVEHLTKYAKQGKTGLVIGGGVLGLEAACALSTQGAKMSLIHADDYVLNRQLDVSAALLLQDELHRRHVGLEVSAFTDKIILNDKGDVTGICFKNGRIIPADFVVMAVGIVPNVTLAKQSGIEVNRGIVVDKYMHTSQKDVYAIGECVEIDEELFGMVSSVNQHVDSLISVLCQPQHTERWLPFKSVPLALKLKVSGIAVYSAGQIQFTDEEFAEIETIIYQQDNDVLTTTTESTSDAHYQCLYIKDNRLVGVVLYGETGEGGFYSRLINENVDIGAIKDDLIYGEAYCKDIIDDSLNKAEHLVDDHTANTDVRIATDSQDNTNKASNNSETMPSEETV